MICSKLYWVDSKHKTLDSVHVADGSGRSSVSLVSVTGTAHVFGVAVSSGNAYVSCWSINASIIRVQLSNGAVSVYRASLSNGTSHEHKSKAVFGTVYITNQPSG